MSIGMAVPVRPRNWDKAEVRKVRAVRASRVVVVLGWLILECDLLVFMFIMGKVKANSCSLR